MSKIVLVAGYAQGRNKVPERDRNLAVRERLDAFRTLLLQGWGNEHSPFQNALSAVFLPNATTEQIAWMADLQRMGSSSVDAVRLLDAAGDIDVVELLPKVSAPTLVLHSRHDKMVPIDRGRQIAALIPNAKLVVLDSENHVPRSFEPAWPAFLEAVQSFLSRA